MEKQEYSIIEHQIDKSARLLMYTDGFSEAFNSVLEQYDGRRLLEFLAQRAQLPRHKRVRQHLRMLADASKTPNNPMT